MKYAVLCLYTGDYIALNNLDIFRYCENWVKDAANTAEIVKNRWEKNWPTKLLFDTKDAADWFVRRRLSFNSRRTDRQKLMIMNELFELNGLSNLSSKIEYEIIEVEEENS